MITLCDTCEATAALETSCCKNDHCHLWRTGYRKEWRSGPMIRQVVGKELKHLVNDVPRIFFPEIYIRAKGKGAEFKPTQFQIRRGWDPWPKTWIKSKDLAGSMSRLDIDMKWDCVSGPMKDYVLGHRDRLPSSAELKRWQKKEKRTLAALIKSVVCDSCSARGVPLGEEVPCRADRPKLRKALAEFERKRKRWSGPKTLFMRTEDHKGIRRWLLINPETGQQWETHRERLSKREASIIASLKAPMKVDGKKVVEVYTGRSENPEARR